MKFSKDTLSVLKNFAAINSNLMIKEGNTLSTISVSKALVAVAKVEDTFPQDFGIYDIQEFLGVLSLFEEPELNFDNNSVSIVQGKNSIKYHAASETVLTYPKKFPKLADAELTFELTSDDISKILKTGQVLKTTDFAFVADGETLKVIVKDKSSSSANSFVLEIGDTTDTFTVNINADNFKVTPDNYSVGIIDKRILNLKSDKLEYIVAIESDSKI